MVYSRFLWFRTFFSTLLLCAFTQSLCAQRAIPDDNLAYPVLIRLGNGSAGSGFYLQASKAVFLVTAKHVLFDPATKKLLDLHVVLLSYSKDPIDVTPNLASLDLAALQTAGNIKSHPSEDVAVIRLFNTEPKPGGGYSLRPEQGVVITQMSKNGLTGAPLNLVKSFDEVLAGNDVMVFGFPSSLTIQQIPQLDPNRPLLRKGIVAGTNAEKRSIILDCPSYFGNSGGPAVEIDRSGFETNFRIIGVISQYVPFIQTGGSQTFAMQFASNSGYSIATPMDFVLELLK